MGLDNTRTIGCKQGFVELDRAEEHLPPRLSGVRTEFLSLEDITQFYKKLAHSLRLQRTGVSQKRPVWQARKTGIRVFYPYEPEFTDQKNLEPYKGVSLYDGVHDDKRYLVSISDDLNAIDDLVTRKWNFTLMHLNLRKSRGPLLRYAANQLLVRQSAVESVIAFRSDDDVMQQDSPQLWLNAKDLEAANQDPVFEQLLHPYKLH